MKKIVNIIFIALLVGCAPTRYVVPLNKREKSVGVAYGGPVVEDNGTIMPVPILSLTYAKGKTNNLTYFGGVLLSPVLEGYYAAEIGALREWKWWSKRKIGLTTNFVANVSRNNQLGGINFFPQFDMNLYWHFRSDPHYFCDCPGDSKWKMYSYVGFQTHYNVVSNYDVKDPFKDDVLFSPHLGYSFGTGTWRFVTEVKWIQPWVDNTVHDPEIWNPLSNAGTFGGFLTYYQNF